MIRRKRNARSVQQVRRFTKSFRFSRKHIKIQKQEQEQEQKQKSSANCQVERSRDFLNLSNFLNLYSKKMTLNFEIEFALEIEKKLKK